MARTVVRVGLVVAGISIVLGCAGSVHALACDDPNQCTGPDMCTDSTSLARR